MHRIEKNIQAYPLHSVLNNRCLHEIRPLVKEEMGTVIDNISNGMCSIAPSHHLDTVMMTIIVQYIA